MAIREHEYSDRAVRVVRNWPGVAHGQIIEPREPRRTWLIRNGFVVEVVQTRKRRKRLSLDDAQSSDRALFRE